LFTVTIIYKIVLNGYMNVNMMNCVVNVCITESYVHAFISSRIFISIDYDLE